MTTRSPAVRTAAVLGLRVARGPGTGGPTRSTLVALGTGTAGALLLGTAPAFTIASATDAASTAPAATAGPLLAVLAVVPVALAWLLAGTGRAGLAAGVLAGLAALAPGRAVLDLQLLMAPWKAARPELLVPTSLAPLRAGAGVWLLLAGHVLTAAAGVLVLRAVRQAGVDADAPRTGAFTAALCCGVAAGIGLVLPAFRSSDAHLVPLSMLDAPPLTAVGMVLLAGCVVLAATLAASAPDADLGRGGLVGLAVGVVAVALPALAVAAFAAPIRIGWGPPVALAGAAALVGVARLVRPTGIVTDAVDEEPSLPALGRLHRAAGVLAVLAGLAALLGAATRQVTVSTGVTTLVLDAAILTVRADGLDPVLHVTRLLVPAGLLLVALGVALLLPRGAALVRPALAVAWAGMVLTAAAVLDAALTMTQLTGVRAGFGLWAVTVALLAAPAVGVLTLMAGGVERDETDLSELRSTRVPLAVGALAAVLVVPAFGLPLQSAPDYVPAGLWSHFGVASWGLLVAAVTVLAAALLAPHSRPRRAVASLLGAAAVVALHLAQVPLAGGRAGTDATVAAGFWSALACLAALLAAAAVVWQGQAKRS